MIEVLYSDGALYLQFDEPLSLVKEPIKAPSGFTINVGDKVHRIGKKVRTMFKLKDGLYMEYEGVLLDNGSRLAVFNVPQHNENVQADLFKKPVQYRYCLYMVEVKGKFKCFLSGNHLGMRDIVIDDLELIK